MKEIVGLCGQKHNHCQNNAGLNVERISQGKFSLIAIYSVLFMQLNDIKGVNVA
jgi:hypothetical protein